MNEKEFPPGQMLGHFIIEEDGLLNSSGQTEWPWYGPDVCIKGYVRYRLTVETVEATTI